MTMSNGHLYAIVDETVEIFDIRLKKSIKSINTVFGPSDLAVASNQKFVYVVNNKKVAEITIRMQINSPDFQDMFSNKLSELPYFGGKKLGKLIF